MSDIFNRKALSSIIPPEQPRPPLSDEELDDCRNIFLAREDFVVVLPNDDFHSTTGGVMKRKSVKSEVLHGKLSRKLGSVKVIPLSESQEDEWVTILYPGC